MQLNWVAIQLVRKQVDFVQSKQQKLTYIIGICICIICICMIINLTLTGLYSGNLNNSLYLAFIPPNLFVSHQCQRPLLYTQCT